jgi:hypothetical protein
MIAAICAALLPGTARAEELEWGDFTGYIEENEAYIEGYTGVLKDIVVPESINGYNVVYANFTALELTSLDVSGATELRILGCALNSLTSLDVSKNSKLTALSFFANDLNTIDVSKNPKLERLSCAYNKLVALDVSNNRELRELDCEACDLTALDISQNLALEYLYCGENQLTSLDTRQNPVLRTLDCSVNSLTLLDVSKNVVLEALYCSGNKLTNLDVSKNLTMKTLYCSSNYFTSKDKIIGLNEASLDSFGYGTQKVVQNQPFTDLLRDVWYTDYVAYAYDNRLFAGTSDTTFSPDAPMTRAMVVTVLHNYAGKPAAPDANPFSDVPAGAWYSKPVIWAAENRIVSGLGDGRFDPDGDVTREQLAVILCRYAEKLGLDTSGGALDFSDTADISFWAAPAVQWCVNAGIVSGYPDSTFRPQGSATRAEIAAMIHGFVWWVNAQ